MKKSLLLAISMLCITSSFSMDNDNNDNHPNGCKWGLIKDMGIIDSSHEDVSKFKKGLNLAPKNANQSYKYNTGDLVELSITKVGQNKLTKDSGWPLVNVYDQGTLGSCTANSVALCLRFQTVTNSKNPTKVLNNEEMLSISRLYHYYNTRIYEGDLTSYPKNTSQDNGATIYGSVLTSKLFGFIAESFQKTTYTSSDKDLSGTISYYYWPYDVTTFAIAPHTLAYVESFSPDYMNSPYSSLRGNFRFKELDDQFKTGNTTSALQMQQFRDILVGELAKNRPIDFGISLDQYNFNFDKNGFFIVPGNIDINTYMNKSFKPDAGHAMVIVGYGPYKKINGIDPRDTSNYYKAYTSWGNFGDPKSPGAIYFQEGYINNIAKAGTEAISIWLENPQQSKPKFAPNAALPERLKAAFSDPDYFKPEETPILKDWYENQESQYKRLTSFVNEITTYNTELEKYLNASKTFEGVTKSFDTRSRIYSNNSSAFNVTSQSYLDTSKKIFDVNKSNIKNSKTNGSIFNK